MAAIVTSKGNHAGDDVWGSRRVRIVTVTGDDDYVTGGYEIGQPRAFGMTQIDVVLTGAVSVNGLADPSLIATYDEGPGTLIFSDADGTEVAAATDMSDASVTLVVVGN